MGRLELIVTFVIVSFLTVSVVGFIKSMERIKLIVVSTAVTLMTVSVVSYIDVGRDVIGRSHCLHDATYFDFLFTLIFSSILPCAIQSLLLICIPSRFRSRRLLVACASLVFPAACIISSHWLAFSYSYFSGETWTSEEVFTCFILYKPWTFPLVLAGAILFVLTISNMWGVAGKCNVSRE